MYAERVIDAKGNQWTIEQRWTPWRRRVRMEFLFDPRPERLALPEAQAAEQPPRESWSRGRQVALGVALTPLVVFDGVGLVVVSVFVVPVAALELVLLGIVGLCLGLVRATGLVRQRVEITCRTGHLLHSRTVLLVHGHRRARRLVDELAMERYEAKRPLSPTTLPADVSVRAHRSIWNSPETWIPKRRGS